MAQRGGGYARMFRGETSFDFAGRWRRWAAISGLIIVIGFVALGVRGLNFSIDFKGGTVWEVPTTASVSTVRGVLGGVSPTLAQANIQTLTNSQTGKQIIKVQAAASTTSNAALVAKVTSSLAGVAGVTPNDVQLNDVGPSWGSDITTKAVRAVIVFLVVVTAYIWFRFEAKMALAALVALVHDILVTVGIYSLSGFTVSPDTVIAFLTILGYSLYDTIVVFDKVQENTKGLAASGKVTYTDTVNLSMNQVLARSINTSFVAIIPILSILVIGAWVLGATALEDFGLALFIGLTTGAYSSIFIASPLLGLLKEREPRYSQIRKRLAGGPALHLTPRAFAAGQLTSVAAGAGAGGGPPRPRRRSGQAGPATATATAVPVRGGTGTGNGATQRPETNGGAGRTDGGDGERLAAPDSPEPLAPPDPGAGTTIPPRAGPRIPPRTGSSIPPRPGPPARPRKKGKRR